MNKAIIWVVVAAVVIVGVWLIFADRGDEAGNVQNGGNGGNSTVEESPLQNLPAVGTQATANEIVVESPEVGGGVSSPVTVRGRARGPWYFEASAPVLVIDTTGKMLGQGYVTAQGEWMTEEFVPFEGTIEFADTDSEGGAIIFMNDNPSGDPERSKYIAVPVFFR